MGLRKLIDQVDAATAGSVGNLMAEDDRDKCDQVLRKLTFINYFFVFCSLFASCLYCLSSTLVRIMYGLEYTYNADSMIGLMVVFCLCVNFFLTVLRNPLWRFMSVSGLFAKDKKYFYSRQCCQSNSFYYSWNKVWNFRNSFGNFGVSGNTNYFKNTSALY